jgi:transposase
MGGSLDLRWDARSLTLVRGQPSRTATRVNLLLAIDINVGPVAWWLYEENTTADVFVTFIRDYLLPRLSWGIQRTILWDNLAAHFTDNVAIDLLSSKGHRVVSRPTYSPDMAPIESAFSKVKYLLRRNKDLINADNFTQAIDLAVQQITVRDCQGWYQDCHYFVPGREYRPYEGIPIYTPILHPCIS